VKRVEVLVMGRARMLIPAGESWDSWFDGEGVSADFMEHREQPADQVRESL
jgi:antitoxin VapB